MKRIKWWMVFGAGFLASLISPDVGGILGLVGVIWGLVELVRWIRNRPSKPKTRADKETKVKLDISLSDWSVWDDSVHKADGQPVRIRRSIAQNFPVIQVKKGGVSVLRGSKGDYYHVSFENCTCEDFKRRHLPCKHMYYLAIASGQFDPSLFVDLDYRNLNDYQRFNRFKRACSGNFTPAQKTTLSSCDCGDFEKFGLPCVHMYDLALSSGVYDEAFSNHPDLSDSLASVSKAAAKVLADVIYNGYVDEWKSIQVFGRYVNPLLRSGLIFVDGTQAKISDTVAENIPFVYWYITRRENEKSH